jgi:EAL domain-containing protein (putative c-di-GMP-specific phosphodiesterase class I)/GGDEF domain-containing protein
MKRRAFLGWFMELMIWMTAVLIFGCMAIVFEMPVIYLVSVVAALMMILRIKGMQYVYEYQQAMIKVMNDCMTDTMVIIWISYQRKAVVSGSDKVLAGDIIPMKNEMSREQMENLLNKLQEHPIDTERNIYKVSLIGEVKYLQLEQLEEQRFEAYVIKDVTTDVVNKEALLAYTYYDMKTKLLSRDAFSNKLEEALLRNKDYVCYMTLEVDGGDKVVSEQEDRLELCYERIGMLLKELEEQDAIVGRTSKNKFVVAVLHSNAVDAMQLMMTLSENIKKTIEAFNKLNNMKLTYGGGICHYPAQADNYKSLLGKADFALFEARSQGDNLILEYSDASFASREQEYIKIQEFNRLINGNLFDYYYQPIVSARTGEIFAYEALMRPRSDILKTPPEVLNIAEKEDRLDDIERLTLQNTMRILSENQDVFKKTKLFINSIPNCKIGDVVLDTLMDNYGALFEKVVVEITEERDLDEATEQLIRERYRASGSMIALDDYGSGYSNDSNMLKIQPDFVKIDRSLLINIDKDDQKKHLVGNMVSFAKQHGIMVIAEGLEREEEIAAVIALGADLIQGFYTSKPRPVFLLEISQEASEKIKMLNAGK